MDRMATTGADFTNTFRGLTDDTARKEFSDPEAFDQWAPAWQARRDNDSATADEQAKLMQRANPAIIPRNHQIEAVIQSGLKEDFTPFHALTEALKTPFDARPAGDPLTLPPTPEEEVTRTFCGT
jgi:uncharacterized protein YdiU (UPF0061 family)